ncbi:MAG: AAA family ATPase [Pseudomonadota bacterium]|nr:AAA family ATPase [Pseudomonadota bacterium]
MRQAGSSNNVASVVVIGVDARAMGQIRETLGAEAALPAQATRYEDALAVIRKLRPDVVIAGFDQDFEEAIRIAPQIVADNGRCQLVALASHANPDHIRAAMRAGYREFVVLPDDAELLRQAVHEAIYQEGGDEDHGEVIAVWGSKGGAGATFLSVNLAAELSPVHRVCVVDLDFSMGDVAAFLDIQPSVTIADLMRNLHKIDERMLAGHVVVHPSKVHAVAQPTDLEQREEVKGDTVMRILTTVARTYQYCLVDCGSRLDEATLTAATVADRILLIATPDVPGIKNTWRRLQLIERLGIEKSRVHVVINRWDKREAPFSLADVEQNILRKVDATVAFDKAAARAVNEGKLLREVDKKCPAAKDIEALVGLVTDGEMSVERRASGPMGWFSRFSGG